MDDITSRAESGTDRRSGRDVAPDRDRQDLRRVAHDVNDMLTIIVGNADLISYDTHLSEAGREDLAELRRAAEALRKLASSLALREEASVTSLADSLLEPQLHPQLRLPL
ncbi:MAG: hypothetical protein R3223_07660 [Longimicrobiales bacterium]|nr:hypothetical protein [Longimicrobiales bacterium]